MKGKTILNTIQDAGFSISVDNSGVNLYNSTKGRSILTFDYGELDGCCGIVNIQSVDLRKDLTLQEREMAKLALKLFFIRAAVKENAEWDEDEKDFDQDAYNHEVEGHGYGMAIAHHVDAHINELFKSVDMLSKDFVNHKTGNKVTLFMKRI